MRRRHHGYALIEAAVAVFVVAMVALSVLSAVSAQNKNARLTEPGSAATIQISNINTDLQAATMYDSGAVSQLAGSQGRTWVLTPPTPPANSVTLFLPSDQQSTTYTVSSASSSSVSLTYSVSTGTRVLQSGRAVVPIAQRAPVCNPVTYVPCAAH